MSVHADDIPHAEYIAQLSRHLVSIPSSQIDTVKRGCVAIIIRLVISNNSISYPTFNETKYAQNKTAATLIQALDEFLSNPGFKNACAQILFIQRAKYPGDPWSGQIGFPGGKQDPTDASDQETAERETMEELGLDLSDSKSFIRIGLLDDVQAYLLFRGVKMAISPQVYLQVSQNTPGMILSDEVASAHWIDFGHILQRIDHPVKPFSKEYLPIPANIVTRMFPKYAIARPLWFRMLSTILGKLYYTVLPLKFMQDHSIIHTSPQQQFDGDTPADTTYAHVSLDYEGCQFVSNSELYLWGVSLEMLSNLVDLALPVAPSDLVARGYHSVVSPWPQMDPIMWADINFISNTIHRFLWGPYRRKPWHIKAKRNQSSKDGSSRKICGNDSFFLSYFRILSVVFPISCIAKMSLLYFSGKFLHNLLVSKVVRNAIK
ncbi:hypothetical protein COEREDRAFT_10623 [Coemansia reversa NRRL 1564]|uniref:Nudix hydrolase domain-containing protein n=1 Tax=Coemansia reversa (strain ATCC 12441 / NRRL 1564) TaxID=763665 RepID=A0A2G5B5H2_COERN|nr:hypothetical protein COEREDRAFT_10623 [Coemansia reversa NRRL 1564]|eukprot:PIA14268.1 hypothetical protein COEREDRAFT_10623 [Coemansia reversa NRRL 1564]